MRVVQGVGINDVGSNQRNRSVFIYMNTLKCFEPNPS